MRTTLRDRRPSPAIVIASLALFVALSGTAVGQSAFTAAKRLITGKDIKNGSITSGDVRNGSLQRRDFKAGQLPAAVDAYTKPQSDARYLGKGDRAADAGRLGGLAATDFLRSNAPAGGDLAGTFPAPAIGASAVDGSNVADMSLTLSDLGGSRPDEMTTTTNNPIALAPGACQAQLTGNFGDGVVGDLVVGTLTDAAGEAVLPNSAAFVPSVVIKTTQGGAVPNLVVCNTGNGALTIPTGSVFHWRLIDA